MKKLWSLLKSDELRPSLTTSYDPILQTITLPDDLLWTAGVPSKILFVRHAQLEIVTQVMREYQNHIQQNQVDTEECYGSIIKGTPGIGKCRIAQREGGNCSRHVGFLASARDRYCIHYE